MQRLYSSCAGDRSRPQIGVSYTDKNEHSIGEQGVVGLRVIGQGALILGRVVRSLCANARTSSSQEFDRPHGRPFHEAYLLTELCAQNFVFSNRPLLCHPVPKSAPMLIPTRPSPIGRTYG